MRVIGTIIPKQEYTDDGLTVTNADYIDGKIVEITHREHDVLCLLQDACDGYTYHFPQDMRRGIKDEDMADVFMLIYTFATTEMAINQFREVVENLESIMRGEKGEK